MEEQDCCPYYGDCTGEPVYYVGFARQIFWLFVAFNILGIGSNLFIVIQKLFFKRSTESNLRRLITSISIVELLISVTWLINIFVFKHTRIMANKCSECRIYAIAPTFLYLFCWLLLLVANKNLKKLVSSALIVNNKKSFLISIGICFVIAGALSLGFYFLNLTGVSPMNTCMVRGDFSNSGHFDPKSLLIILFVIFPVVISGIGLYDGISMIKMMRKSEDHHKKKIFLTYGSTLILYFFLMIFIVILYIMDIFVVFENTGVYETTIPGYIRWPSFIFTCFTVLTPVIIGSIEVSHSFFNWSAVCTCFCCRRLGLCDFDDSKSEVFIRSGERVTELDQIQEKSNKQFLSNVYLAVSYCMEKSKMQEKGVINQILENEKLKANTSEGKHDLINRHQIEKMKKYATHTQEHQITHDAINEIQDSKLRKDEVVKGSVDLSFTCEEHAPIIFGCLREIDGISEDLIIQSCLPALNRASFEKSQGRSASVFLSTHNKEFLIKSIEEGDIKLIKTELLHSLTEYFYHHQDSLISRLYGVYSIKIKDGTVYHFILMKDVCGIFDKNITTKYDLKGSTLNRDVNINLDIVNKQVLKDINFKDNEIALRLRKEDAKNLAKILQDDVVFLANRGIMDYSLFVVNLDLSIKETEILFGKNHFETMNYEYQQRMKEIIDDEPMEVEELTEEEKNLLSENKEENKIYFDWKQVSRIKKHVFPSLTGNKVVILALIDYFQVYNFNKSLETKFKQLAGNKKEQISSMSADGYVTRFLQNLIPIIKGAGILKDADEI